MLRFQAVATFLLGVLLTATPSGAAVFQLNLIPESFLDALKQEDPRALAAVLPSDMGTAFLYRVGDSAPPIVVSTAAPIQVGTGEWIWMAEAPGWVTVLPIRMTVGSDHPQDKRDLLWPVVPACSVSVAPVLWRGIRRLDFVSLERGSVYRLDLRQRQSLNVPAGRFLYYAVGPRGLVGISRILRCAHEEQVALGRPDLPPPEVQDVMLHLTLPETAEPIGLDRLAVEFVSNGREVRRAAAAVVRGSRKVTAFLPDLPAAKDGSILVSHPRLVTEEIEVGALGGTARDLGETSLALRGNIELKINYLPLRQHSLERIEVLKCRRRAKSGGDNCTTPVFDASLEEGLHEYRTGPLDDGQYRVDAIIDDERVHGLGDGVFQTFEDGEPDSGFSPARHPPHTTVELREFEIFGHVLFEGEPVPGELVLFTSSFAPPRRFPTGEGLEFSAHYFGRSIVQRDPMLQLADETFRPIEERLGLNRGNHVMACTSDGQCRDLGTAIIRGGGRLDVEVAVPPRISVSVTNRATGKPIEGALCSPSGFSSRRLVFVNGEVDWEAENTSSELVIHRALTDESGTAVFYGVPDDLRGVGVDKAGYKKSGHDLEGVAIGEDFHLAIELDPETSGVSTLLVSSGGEKLAGALAVRLLDSGTLGSVDRSCSTVADAEGVAILAEECLAGTTLLVMDPRVRLKPLAGDLLLHQEQVEVAAVVAPAARIRVIDENGAPLQGLGVELLLRDVRLSRSDLIHALSNTGREWPYATGEDGLLTLLGIDAHNADRGWVVVGAGDSALSIGLEGLVPGEIREVVYSGQPP